VTRGAFVETEVRAPRPAKVAVVDEVRERLEDSDATILTEYRGLSVAQLQVLRRALAPAGGEYKVYKNTLVRRAAKESGLEELEALLTGPTALTFVRGDVSAVAKALKDFARQHPTLVVKGAIVGGGLVDAAQTSAIADLPSRDVLLAQIAGALAAPMQRFAGLLQALPQKFAYALAALIEERGGVPTPAPEENAVESAPDPEPSVEAAPKDEPSGEEAVAGSGPAVAGGTTATEFSEVAPLETEGEGGGTATAGAAPADEATDAQGTTAEADTADEATDAEETSD
jgi:large subunit ribosomal protein L10